MKHGKASRTQHEWNSTGAKQSKDVVKVANFVALVKEQGLTGKEDQWLKNKVLVAYARKFKDRVFIPEWFLNALKLTPDLTCGGRFPDWDIEDHPEPYDCTLNVVGKK